MAHSSGSVAARRDVTSRSNRTVDLNRHAAMHRLLGGGYRLVESTATILILILLSDAALSLFVHGSPKDWEQVVVSPFERGLYWLAYAFTFSQLLIRPRAIIRTALRNPFILAMVLTAGLSVIWSDDPSTSLRNAIPLCTWTVFGYYLAARYETDELLTHLGIAMGIIAVSSLATALVLPDYGRESDSEAAWRGVFTTKNVLGEMMLLAVVVFGILTRRAGLTRVLAVLGLIIAIVLIAFAKATAALLIVPVLALTIPVVLTFRRNNAAAALVLCLLIGAAAAGSILITQKDSVLSVLGKDATLTGRTVLWSQVEQHIEDRPILGHGLGAFWEPTSATSQQVRAAIGWDTPHSHNALLDEWLDLGLVGVMCLVAAFLLGIGRAWAAMRASPGVDGLWAMAFLVMLFLGNTTESSLSRSYAFWALFVAVASMYWRTHTDAGARGVRGGALAEAPARVRPRVAARR